MPGVGIAMSQGLVLPKALIDSRPSIPDYASAGSCGFPAIGMLVTRLVTKFEELQLALLAGHIEADGCH